MAMAITTMGTSFLREWDEASKAHRNEIVQWLLKRLQNAHATGSDLQHACGGDVSLLLPRILAWITKANKPLKPTSRSFAHETIRSIDDQLACVQLFLSSPIDAHLYLHEFMEADGLRVLLETLQRTDGGNSKQPLSPSHKCVIYRILLQIIQRGRIYKQQISQLDGELALVRGAIVSGDHTAKSVTVPPNPNPNLQSNVWTLCRATLLEQMTGNALCMEATHRAILFMLHHEIATVAVVGAQILREKVSEPSFFFDAQYCSLKGDELVPQCMELLQSKHIALQHEGLELVHALLRQPSLRRPICAALASWIHDAALAADPVEQAYASMQHTREYELFIHLRCPFVHAAQSLTALVHSQPLALLPLLVQKHEILILLAFVLTVERPHSLKWRAASTAIHLVFTHCHQVALAHLSELFLVDVDQLADLPRQIQSEELAMELLGDDSHQQLVALQFHRNGWVRPMEAPPIPYIHRDQDDKDDNDDDDVDDDAQLRSIEYAVEAAVHPVLPSLLLHSSRSVENENEDLPTEDCEDDEELDFAKQQQLQQRLERHFNRFRSFVART